MHFFETHAHPDHSLVEDRELYISEMRRCGIDKMVIAPIAEESNYQSMQLFPKDLYPEVYFAKGLHPKNATSCALWDEKKLAQFCTLLEDDRVVAVKSGLDFCKTKLQPHQLERQYEFLSMFMRLAKEYGKPLVLHIRQASEEALAFFEKEKLTTAAEIHCFTYDRETMHRFIEAGINYFGIGGMVTRAENEALQAAVKDMPLEMILLESDSPFVRVEGDTSPINTSAKALPVVAKKIAELKNISVEQVVEQTYRNACRFFKLQ